MKKILLVIIISFAEMTRFIFYSYPGLYLRDYCFGDLEIAYAKFIDT